MARDKYLVNVTFDQDGTWEGWDGDEPLNPRYQWSCYTIQVIKVCGCCGHRDDDNADYLGGVWLSDAKSSDSYLRGNIRDMVGKGPRWADIEISTDR